MLIEDTTRPGYPGSPVRRFVPDADESRATVPLPLLREITLLEDLPEKDLEDIAALLRPRVVGAGTFVFREGERGESVFLIVDGTFDVVGHTSTAEFIINQLHTGDFFGELAVVDGQPRSASVRAASDALLLELKQDDFFEVFSKNASAARVVLQRLSARMRRITTDLELRVEAVERAHAELVKSYESTLGALTRALDLRDAETENHSHRVMKLAARLARAAGLSARQEAAVRRGALLHDVGKIGVPDAILRKPGLLTDEETLLIRNHPEWGYAMLKEVSFLADSLPLILHHHEKYDGSGYPRGLAGGAIPIEARIFAIVDAFDAMTSDRPYRPRRRIAEALRELESCSGTHFDPELVRAFRNLLVEESPGIEWENEMERGVPTP